MFTPGLLSHLYSTTAVYTDVDGLEPPCTAEARRSWKTFMAPEEDEFLHSNSTRASLRLLYFLGARGTLRAIVSAKARQNRITFQRFWGKLKDLYSSSI